MDPGHAKVDEEPLGSHMETETEDEEQATRYRGHMETEISDQVHATNELGTINQQSDISDQEPGKGEPECVTSDQEFGLRDQEHLTCYQKPVTNEYELRTRGLEHTCDNLDADFKETRLQEYATSDQRARIHDQEPMMKNEEFDSGEQYHGIRKRNPGIMNTEHCSKEKNNKDRGSPSCLVCFENYDTRRRPRMLPCGHSLCSSCISNMIIGSSITCPTCQAQKVITSADQVPINYDLERLTSPEADITEADPMLYPKFSEEIFGKRFVRYFNLKNFTGLFLICAVIIFLSYHRNTTIISTEDTRTTEITKVMEHIRQQQISRNSEQMASFEQAITYLDKYDKLLKTGEENFRETVQEIEVSLEQCKQLLPHFEQERDWVRKVQEEGIMELKVLVYNQENLRKSTTSRQVTQAVQDARHHVASAQAWLQNCNEYVYDIGIKKALQFLEVMKFSLKLLNTDIVEFLNTNFADMLQSLQKQVLRELIKTELLYCEVILHNEQMFRHVTFQDNTIHLGTLEKKFPPARAFILPLSDLVQAVLTTELTPVYITVMGSGYIQVVIQDNKIAYHTSDSQPPPNKAMVIPLTELIIATLSQKSTPVYAMVMRNSSHYFAQLLFQDEKFILQSFQHHPVPDHAYILSLDQLLEVLLTVNLTPVFVMMKNNYQYSSQVVFQDNKFVIHPLKLQSAPNHAITLKLDELLMAMITKELLPVYVVMMKDARQYSSKVMLQDEMVILQSFKDHPAPDYSLILSYNSVKLFVDDASAVTFLDLAWNGEVKGRVYIQLIGKSGRGQLFLNLCTGRRGPSYRKSQFFRVNHRYYAGEEIIGGDYENNDGSGGDNLEGLINGKEQSQLAKVGLVYGVNFQRKQSAQFAIMTKSHSSDVDLVFGKVRKGMKLVDEAVAYTYSHDNVIIEECGLVLPL